jgi:ERCC4-type nuclease
MKTIFKKPLEDIFSKPKKKKEKNFPRFKIKMDYREKNSLVYSHLIKLNFGVEIQELKVADYIVNNVAIERKTVSDFISSMINKRLLKQLEELQQYPNKLLLIEGVDEQEIYSEFSPTRMHPNSVRGFLLSILLKHKIPIIFTKNPQDTAKFIYVLAKKQDKEISLKPTKKNLTKKEQIQFILEGFPGIGPKTARKLIKEFKTLKNIFNVSEEELQKILGKKATNFKDLLN